MNYECTVDKSKEDTFINIFNSIVSMTIEFPSVSAVNGHILLNPNNFQSVFLNSFTTDLVIPCITLLLSVKKIIVISTIQCNKMNTVLNCLLTFNFLPFFYSTEKPTTNDYLSTLLTTHNIIYKAVIPIPLCRPSTCNVEC